MTIPITLALPCRVLALDVLVGPPDGVTPLEDLVARGVLTAGQADQNGATTPGGDPAAATMTYLTTLLCLPQRVVLEVIGTLWSKGHLTVDYDSGGIELSEAARARITGHQSLAAEGELQTREFMFEPITGMILSTFHGRGRASETSIRFPLRPQLKVSDLPEAELVSSVQAALRTERRRRGRVNVLSVGFGSPALRSAERIVWLEVDAVAHRDLDNDRIQFTIEAPTWSLRSRQRLNTYFDQLAADEPDHPAVQAVRGRAEVGRESPSDLDDLFRQLARRLDGLAETEVSLVQSRHRALADWSGQIADRLDGIREAHARVSLITRPEGHVWTTTDLIDSAQRQVVLVVPDPDPTGVRPFQPALRRALDRDVQVVFVWGRSANDRLNPQVENFLDELRLRRGARVLRNEKSAKTEACLVIQDDCRAMVGSHSVLGRHAPSAAEVSVLIEPVEQGPDVPEAVADLLRWTKREFDRWVQAQEIEQAHSTAPARAPRPERPAPPMTNEDAAQVDASSLALWAAAWNDVYRGLLDARRQLLAELAVVEVVRDAEHRTLLWDGLRGAEYRLVVSDDQLNARSAGPAVARTLRERRAAGAVVHLLHPAPPQSEPDLAAFAELPRDTHSVQVHHQRTGGRLLIADNRVLVGSFSPLNDHRNQGVGRRVSSLGVQIRDERLAAELAGLLGTRESAPARDQVAAAVPEPPLPGTGASAGMALLIEARSAPGPDFGRVAAERLRTYAEPFAVLSAWRDSEVPDDQLRRAAAAALHAGLGPTGPAEEWLGWLIEDAWSRGAYVEAALLSRWRPRAGEEELVDPDQPMRAVALLAAALEIGPLTDEMAEAVFDLGDSRGAKTAAVAALACDVLVHGQTDRQELLSLLTDGLAPAWRELGEQVESFGSAPLPLSRFTVDQNRAETARSLAEKRIEIAVTVDRIEALRNRFSFEAGIVLHRELFRTGGLLQQVRAAARAGVAECQELAPQLPRDVHRHLDDLIAAAGGKPMEWMKQIHFLRRIEGLVQDLRSVAAASGEVQSGRQGADRGLAEAIKLGKHLGEHWGSLYAEALAVGRPWEWPAVRLLSVLNPLMAWAKEQP